MKKLKSSLLVLALFLSVFLNSCLMESPTIVDSNGKPYQPPAAPGNVMIDNGRSDGIVITWDAVENADGYVVKGIIASSFAEGLKDIKASITGTKAFISSDILNGSFSNEIQAGQDFSYIFTVNAISFFNNGQQRLMGPSSGYMEGAMAPEKVQLHIVANNNDIDFYWNSPNMFKTMTSGHSPETLYDASFFISFGKTGTDESTWTRLSSSDVGYSGDFPWLFQTLSINNYGFELDQEYSFFVNMEIQASDGSVVKVNSDRIDFTVTSTMETTPIPSSDIVVSDNRTDGVLLTWLTPLFTLSVDENNALFKIERSEVGHDSWTMLADEISTMTSSANREFLGYEGEKPKFAFLDNTAELGKRYVYRITNAVKAENGVIYTHDSSLLEQSAEGSLFDVFVSDMKGTWDNADSSSATVALSWNAGNTVLPEGLSFAVEKGIYHLQNNTTTYGVVSEAIGFDEDQGLYRCSFSEGIPTDDQCGGTYHEYAYRLKLMNGGTEYKDLGSFIFDDEILSLGTYTSLPLFVGLSASDNRVDRVVVSFTERTYGNVTDEYVYYYSLDGGGEYVQITVEGESAVKSFVLLDVSSEISVKVKAEAGAVSYAPDISVSGRPFALPDDFGFQASYETYGDRIVLSWNKDYRPVEGISYVFEYSTSGMDDWKNGGIIDIASSTHEIPYSDTFDNNTVYDFRIRACNPSYPDEESVYSDPDSGRMLSTVTDVKASKGTLPNAVSVSWTPVDGASYEVARYSEYGDFESIGITDSPSFTDSSYDAEKPYYAVRTVKNGVSSLYSKPSGEMETNLLFEGERADMGYPFNGVVANMDVAESCDSAGYISDYLTIVFDADKTVDRYVVSSDRGPSEEYLMSDLKKFETGGSVIYNNLKNPTEKGYFAYDPSSGKITINTAVGILSTELTVSNITVTPYGNNNEGTASVESKALKRGLGKYDAIFISNTILNSVITAADSTFGGDWWPPYNVGFSKINEYGNSNGSMYVRSTRGGGGYTNQDDDPGFIKLSSYSPYGDGKISFTGTITISVDSGYDWGAGYLGTDPLSMLRSGSISLHMGNSTINGGSRIVMYKDVVISYSNIAVGGGGDGVYKVGEEYVYASDTVNIPQVPFGGAK